MGVPLAFAPGSDRVANLRVPETEPRP